MSCGGHLDRCSGHCCKRFYLPFTPEELQAMAAKVEAGEPIRYHPEEIQKIAAMVIPLKAAKDYEFGVDGETPTSKLTPGWYWTCKHHNAETGDCNNYLDRPRICRDFPFYETNKACNYKECTWEDGKRPPIRAQELTRNLVPRKHSAYDDVTTKASVDQSP